MVFLTFLHLHSTISIFILGAMLVLWALSLILKNSSIVDCFWGAGFVIIAWLAFFLADTPQGIRGLLMLTLVSIWGLRLSAYVLWRNWGKGEDFRYAKWRNENPDQWWWRSLFKVFILQGLIMWVVAAPISAVLSAAQPDPIGFLDYLGTALWAVGFFFESLGDFQLAKFKAKSTNRGKVLSRGVWQFTRHPNYFGDAAQWWGFYALALAAGAWWTVVSPILMTYLLVCVSGVALLEQTLQHKPGYADYAAKTSAFIPWFPKK